MRHLTLIPLLLVSTSALAGRPFTTEDAGVLGFGECEIEASFTVSNENGANEERGWWLQPGCGIGLRTQIAIGGGRVSQNDESSSQYSLVGKTWLKELTEDATGIAIAYGGGQTKQPGYDFLYDNAMITGVVSIPVHSSLVHLNLGWARSRLDNNNDTVWGIAWEKPNAFGPVDIGIESFGADSGAPWVQAGIRWNVIEDRFSLDASAGVQTGGAKGQAFSIGAKFGF